ELILALRETTCLYLPRQLKRTDVWKPDWIMMLDWVGPLLLCRDEIERVPRDVAGVYLLHSFAPEFGGYPIFCAGQTSDIRRRLLEHLVRTTTKCDIVALRRLTQPYF